MAWFDIVGGLAGGLQQGLGQWQKAQEAQKTEERQQALLKIQQAQNIRAEQQFAQQLKDQKESEFLKGLSVQDPLNIDPTFAAAYPEQAKTYLTTNPSTGKVMARMDPAKRAEAEQRAQQLEQRARFRTQFGTPDFATLPEDSRIRTGMQAIAAGIPPQEVMAGIGSLSPTGAQLFRLSIINPEKAAEIAERAQAAAEQNKTTLQAAGITAGARKTAENQANAYQTFQIANDAVNKIDAELKVAKKALQENMRLAPKYRAVYEKDVADLTAARDAAIEQRNTVLRNAPNLKNLSDLFAPTTTPAPAAGSGGSSFMAGKYKVSY
jgi:hypothetical protein